VSSQMQARPQAGAPCPSLFGFGAVPVIPRPASPRDAGKRLAPTGPAAAARVSLTGSQAQPRPGEKWTFGVRQCFPMVTELEPGRFPWWSLLRQDAPRTRREAWAVPGGAASPQPKAAGGGSWGGNHFSFW